MHPGNSCVAQYDHFSRALFKFVHLEWTILQMICKIGNIVQTGARQDLCSLMPNQLTEVFSVTGINFPQYKHLATIMMMQHWLGLISKHSSLSSEPDSQIALITFSLNMFMQNFQFTPPL